MIRHREWLAWRLPYRLWQVRTTFPEAASVGDTRIAPDSAVRGRAMRAAWPPQKRPGLPTWVKAAAASQIGRGSGHWPAPIPPLP